MWQLSSFLAVLAVGPQAAASPDASGRGHAVFAPDDPHVMAVAASARLAILAGTGRNAIQPVGFGFGFHFRYFGTIAWPLRMGVEASAGHSQVYERLTVPMEAGSELDTIRYASLSHTDFAGGIALQIAARPVVVEAGGGAGVGINAYDRPFQGEPDWTERVFDASPMVYGDARIGVPLRGNHGLIVGGGVQQFFSKTSVPTSPDAEELTSPFDLVVLANVGYQMWF